MPSTIVTVGSRVGLHARPASLLVKAAAGAGVPVTIGRVGDKQVNAASMLSVLALGVKQGEELEITVGDAPNADEVLATLAQLVLTDHDNEPAA